MDMKTIYLKMAAVFVAMMMSASMNAKTHDVSGKVIDEQGEPLPFVNVVLLSLPDSMFIQGAVTDAEGAFRIVTDKNEGLLRLTCIGYETLYVKDLRPAQGLTIRMKEDTQLLGEVMVKGQLPKTTLTGEGLKTNVQGSVLENAGTANDVMAKTPGMMKGKDGVEVIGRGAPQVYINGHRVTDASELDRLQSNEIQNIEVISNPGAQYKANVRSVVRIRTVKRQGEGFGFNFNASDAQSLRWSEGNDPRAAVDVNYRTGGVDIFAGVNYTRATNRQLSDLEKTTYSNIVFHEEGDLEANGHTQVLHSNVGVNWQISDNHFMGGKIEWGRQLQESGHTYINDNVYEDGVLTDRLITITDDRLADHPSYTLGGNLYYNGTVGKKLCVDVNLDYYGTETYLKSTSGETGSMSYNTDVFTVSNNDAQLYAAKAVFSYPVWKGQVQAGTEETFTRRTDEYHISGVNIPASSAEVKEDNYAGFATYGFMLPKVGQISAGVRYEYVRYQYEDALAPANNLGRNYGNWFPTVSYAGVLGPVQVMLNYSAKTERPSFSSLSSAIRYNSRYTWQSGNAQLQPELSHDISFTAVWRFFTFMVNYTRTNDAIMLWSAPYGNDGVVLVQPRNLNTPFRAMSAMVNLTPTIGPWTMNYTIGIQPQWLSIEVQDPREPTGTRVTRFNTKPIGFAQLQNTLTLNSGWQFELGAGVSTKGYTENIYLNKVVFDLEAAVQKKLLKNGALVLRLEGHDLAGLANYDVKTDFGNHLINQTNKMDSQRVKFSVRYNFNTAQSKYRGSGAGEKQKARM